MVTAVDPNGSCPLLNESFRFRGQLSGRCEIKWLYTNTVFFSDVLAPELPYRPSFLLDAPDSYDLPSRLGQQIVKAFRSVDYHRSILQEALESYHIGLHPPFAIKEQGSKSEPLWAPPEEHFAMDAMSQENWDEEIEASLRAKSAEHEQADNKIPHLLESEKEEKEWAGVSLNPPYSLSVVSSEADVPCVAASDAGVPLNGVRSDVQQIQDSCNSVEVALSQESVDSFQSRKSSDSDAQGEKHLQQIVTSDTIPPVVETQVDTSDTKGSEATVPPHATDSSSSKRQAKDGLVDTPSNSEEDLNANVSAGTAMASSRKGQARNGRVHKPMNYGEGSKALASSGDHSDWEAGSPTGKIPIGKDMDMLANTHVQSDWDVSSPLMVSSDVEEGMGVSTSLELKSLDNISTTTNSCTLLNSDDKSVTFSLDSSSSTGDSVHNTVPVNVNTSETHSISSDLSNDIGHNNGQEDDVLHGLSDNYRVDIQQDTCVTTQNGDQPNVKVDNSWESETESHALDSVLGKERNTCFSLGSCNSEQSIDNAGVSEIDALQQRGCVGTEYEEGSSSFFAPELLHRLEEEDYLFSPHEVLGISHSADTCSIDENEGMYEYPVEEGKEYDFIAAEPVSSSGIFWARLYRTREQESIFVDLMKRIKASVAASNETLTVPDLHIFKPCSVRGSNDRWHRGVVEKPLDHGAVVRMIDMGVCWNVAIENLMPLANELYLELPPQAFECAIVSNNGDVKKEKHRLVNKHRRIRVVVKALNTSNVDIQVLE